MLGKWWNQATTLHHCRTNEIRQYLYSHNMFIIYFFQEAQWSCTLRPVSGSVNSENKCPPAIFVHSQLQCSHRMQWRACVCMCQWKLQVVQGLLQWPVGQRWPEKEHEQQPCTWLAGILSTQPCSSYQTDPYQSWQPWGYHIWPYWHGDTSKAEGEDG